MSSITPTDGNPTPLTVASLFAPYEIPQDTLAEVFDAAIKMLGERMAAAVQIVLDVQVTGPPYDDPERVAAIDAMKTAEDRVAAAILCVAWDAVEVDR